jgi:putative pyruvate formate lyase activating enzyme
MRHHQPNYLSLGLDALKRRAERAVSLLADCRTCPRDCGVDRIKDRWSACKTGRFAVVGSYGPHFGEEGCLSGWRGSGTIFFCHCNLRCVFCQNHDISHDIRPAAGAGTPPDAIAAMMLDLQDRGCHNINFVTPEHVVPQILEALALAAFRGLSLPLVYNTSAYDSLESIALMDGVIDIYMPDFKYWSSEQSRTYMKAGDYPESARAALRAMHRQVGPLRLDANGLARRGLLIRHLVMPGSLDETRAILEWIAEEIGSDTYVNLMAQYRPDGMVGPGRYAEINRRLTSEEFARARRMAQEAGLQRLDKRQPRPPAQRRV